MFGKCQFQTEAWDFSVQREPPGYMSSGKDPSYTQVFQLMKNTTNKLTLTCISYQIRRKQACSSLTETGFYRFKMQMH